VIDFGVARAAERVQLTAAGGAAGTPSYMAPEVARDATQASPAGDVFSLGATLVFAATGHPPYQGSTVMDILVRLATEPPDLDGVPEELVGLVGACLDRVPRERPTDAAILAGLGSFALPDGARHSYLPVEAMTLIAQYQQSPLVAADAAGGEDDEDSAGSATDGSDDAATGGATSGSHTALPGFESVAGFRTGQRRPSRRRRASRDDAGRGQWHASGTRTASRWQLPGWPVLAVTGALLVAAGTGLGLALHGSSAQALGPVAVSTCGPPPAPASTPQLCVNQPWGDGDTVFVVHGGGFVPFTSVTVTLVGVGVAPRLVTDRQGTFSYAIDQSHFFFHGPIPPRTYQVSVTGQSAQGTKPVVASFRVYGANGAPPPPGLTSVPGPP
jgi:hypothetical protein